MHCKGTMLERPAPFHIDKKGYHLTLDSVPAFVCEQCGEVCFDEQAVDSIQEIIKTLEDHTDKLSAVA